MRITEALKFFFDALYSLYLNVLCRPVFEMFGQTVRFGWVVLGFIVVSMFATLFWRGARG